jgi:hypothetical protein
LNLSITGDMNFLKTIMPGNCQIGIVFYGLMSKERGAEMFTLVCKLTEVDAFHAKLEEMSS